MCPLYVYVKVTFFNFVTSSNVSFYTCGITLSGGGKVKGGGTILVTDGKPYAVSEDKVRKCSYTFMCKPICVYIVITYIRVYMYVCIEKTSKYSTSGMSFTRSLTVKVHDYTEFLDSYCLVCPENAVSRERLSTFKV